MTIMAVPETSVRKYHCPVFRKHKIRFAGKAFVMQTEAETEGMKPTP
jgi:hypothetical protein